MYFTAIAEIDHRWPDGDDKEALLFFHKKRALVALRDLIEKVGKLQYEKLAEVFPSVANCGFTMEEIMEVDRVMIYRDAK